MHTHHGCWGDNNPLNDLFEQWLAADEDWRKTRVYARMTNNTGHIDSDMREWITLTEMMTKMGTSAAEAMAAIMETTKPEHCRDHPDAPGVKDPHTHTCIYTTIKISNMSTQCF